MNSLRQTVEALLDSTQVRWSAQRPDPGAEPGAHELFVAVGSRPDDRPPHPRMLSWKLPQWRRSAMRSSCETVLRSAAALDALGQALGAREGRLAASLELRVHEASLDTASSVLLAVHRVLFQAWPEGGQALCDFVSEWEQGRIDQAGTYERSLASVFYATADLWRAEGGALSREVLELLSGALALNLSREELATLPEALIRGPVRRRLRVDRELYRAELARSRLVQLDLPLDGEATGTRRVDALFLSSSQPVTVLKLLARPDTEHSSYHNGFDVMAVHAPQAEQAYARHTISLPPERSGTLANLAEFLDKLEGAARSDGTPRERGRPRFAGQPNDYADPWYSDGYAAAKGRSTLVAPPYAGTRLSREEIWEAIWDRFNVGRNIHVLASRTWYVRPLRSLAPLPAEELVARGWAPCKLVEEVGGFLPNVARSFLGGEHADVVHFRREVDGKVAYLSLFPGELVLLSVVVTASVATSLWALANEQASLAAAEAWSSLEPISELRARCQPLTSRWLVYGSYLIDRARSSMVDGCRSVVGLLHALASGTSPSLRELPSQAAVDARRVLRDASGDVEHWFTATGGARVELAYEAQAAPRGVDLDAALFLLSTGQRCAVREITRRMAELERRARVSRWQALRPQGDVRGDVMFFTNSLWFYRVSDDPDLNARYLAWHALHDMQGALDAMREQTREVDEHRKERFEKMVGLLLFVFLPITIVCGFFSGAQFNEMDLRLGIPWTTGGWIIFLIYTAVFSVLVYGTFLAGRLLSWRKR